MYMYISLASQPYFSHEWREMGKCAEKKIVTSNNVLTYCTYIMIVSMYTYLYTSATHYVAEVYKYIHVHMYHVH